MRLAQMEDASDIMCPSCQAIQIREQTWIKGELEAKRKSQEILQRSNVRVVIGVWTKLRDRRINGCLRRWHQTTAKANLQGQERYSAVVEAQLIEAQARVEELENLNRDLADDNNLTRQQLKESLAELQESSAGRLVSGKDVKKHERRIESLEAELRRICPDSDLLPKEATTGEKLGGIVMPKMKLSMIRGGPPPARRMPKFMRPPESDD
jgi:predicted RNase H-like nuclease (RuvC/YqgF family)